MNTEQYLERMQEELKGLPEEEKRVLVEEISSHIDEGLADRHLGEADERAQQLAVRMGSPQEMGRRLNNVHRPRRWLEYLLIVVPQIFILPFTTWLLIAIPNAGPTMNPKADDFFMYFGIRGAILVRVVMVVLGIILYKRRGRLTALLFWLCSLCLDIFSLCIREKRWISGDFNRNFGSVVETIFWSAVIIGLLIYILSLLFKQKEPLFFTLATIPFLVTASNLISTVLLYTGELADGYILPDWRLLGFVRIYTLSMLIWPALFLLPKQRIFHWFALLVYAVPMAAPNLVASSPYLWLLLLWTTPILLVSLTGSSILKTANGWPPLSSDIKDILKVPRLSTKTVEPIKIR